MLGRKELDKLSLQKQALLLESGLNRVTLRTEIQSLRASTAWVSEATNASRELTPWLALFAPLAGFLLAKVSRRPDSWLGRMVAAIRWIGPLYRLWRSFAPASKETEAGEPAN